jgi:hypothetical protein
MEVRLDDVERVSTASLINWILGGRRLKLYLRDSTLVQLFISEKRPHELDELADHIRTLIPN